MRSIGYHKVYKLTKELFVVLCVVKVVGLSIPEHLVECQRVIEHVYHFLERGHIIDYNSLICIICTTGDTSFDSKVHFYRVISTNLYIDRCNCYHI